MPVYLMADITVPFQLGMHFVFPAFLIRLTIHFAEVIADQVKRDATQPGLRFAGMLKLVLVAQGFKKHALKNVIHIIRVHHTLLDKRPEHLNLIGRHLANTGGRRGLTGLG